MSRQLIIDKDSSDGELFEAIREGGHDAFSIIYERYNKLLYATAFRYVKERTTAENIVQNVFTKLWECRGDIMITVNLRNYLFTMVKNSILNYARNENVALVKNYEIAQTRTNVDNSLMETIERNQLVGLLDKAIEELPDQKQVVCRMKREGHSNQEIAETLNISINTVKTHYAQAVKILREYIFKYYLFTILITLLVALRVH